MNITIKIPYTAVDISCVLDEIMHYCHEEMNITPGVKEFLLTFPSWLGVGVYRILKFHKIKYYGVNEKLPDEKALPTTSPDALANSPSAEFSYTWIELGGSNLDYGQFYRTEAEAVKNANENYINFEGKLASKNVIIVQVKQQLGNTKDE